LGYTTPYKVYQTTIRCGAESVDKYKKLSKQTEGLSTSLYRCMNHVKLPAWELIYCIPNMFMALPLFSEKLKIDDHE
jgi:hypothetical protein